MVAFNGPLHRVKIGWILLLGLALFFALLYLWFSFFPGAIDLSVSRYFPLDLARKARTYNFPLRVLYIVHFLLQIFLLAWLLFSSKGKILYNRLFKMGRYYWWESTLSIVSIWLLVKLLSLPFSYYTGFYWQKVWGFCTQSPTAWWLDYLKNAGIDLFISLLGGLVFFWLINRFSNYWWLAGAAFFSFFLVVEYLLWPILISPLFNHFEPVSDPNIVTMVNDLAQRAGLSLNGILVMDASKQTTLANAYFTGIGSSKRIVIYDTLLHNYSLAEIRAVLAHEMGHWVHNDIIHGLFYGIIGILVAGKLAQFFLKPWLSNNKRKSPEVWAALQLVLLLIFFVSNPLQNVISRKMELNADAFSLKLTEDISAEIRLQKDLASTSLTDFSPPGFIVWFSYDHPPALTRIHALEKEYHQTSFSTKK